MLGLRDRLLECAGTMNFSLIHDFPPLFLYDGPYFLLFLFFAFDPHFPGIFFPFLRPFRGYPDTSGPSSNFSDVSSLFMFILIDFKTLLQGCQFVPPIWIWFFAPILGPFPVFFLSFPFPLGSYLMKLVCDLWHFISDHDRLIFTWTSTLLSLSESYWPNCTSVKKRYIDLPPFSDLETEFFFLVCQSFFSYGVLSLKDTKLLLSEDFLFFHPHILFFLPFQLFQLHCPPIVYMELHLLLRSRHQVGILFARRDPKCLLHFSFTKTEIYTYSSALPATRPHLGQ